MVSALYDQTPFSLNHFKTIIDNVGLPYIHTSYQQYSFPNIEGKSKPSQDLIELIALQTIYSFFTTTKNDDKECELSYMCKGNIYNEFEVSDKCVKAINRQHALKISSEGKFPIIRIPAQPVDFVTEYEFTRYYMINGKERIVTATSHYSFSEAQTAELFKKDTYIKYARIMIGHRAFIFGARDIANDILMGCMETTELKVVENAPISDIDFVDVSC